MAAPNRTYRSRRLACALTEASEAAQRRIVSQALNETRWNVRAAAQNLGVHRTYLCRLIKRLSLVRPSPVLTVADVRLMVDIMKEALEDGEDVLISGFGKWSVRDKAARPGRNLQTGAVMEIAPRRVVTFKPSAVLRSALGEDDRPRAGAVSRAVNDGD